MTESEFNANVDKTLMMIERSLEASDADLDFECSAGILQISFPDGSKIIVNRQTPNREIWVAARSGGFHFTWKDESWRGTRDDRELFVVLTECASMQAGELVQIAQ